MAKREKIQTTCRCGAVPRFDLGDIRISPEAEDFLKHMHVHPVQLLWLHMSGQWQSWDAATNEIALQQGQMVLSRLPLPKRRYLFLATNAERTTTMIDIRRR